MADLMRCPNGHAPLLEPCPTNGQPRVRCATLEGCYQSASRPTEREAVEYWNALMAEEAEWERRHQALRRASQATGKPRPLPVEEEPSND